MKKNEVHVGGVYAARVSGQLVPVRIEAESRFGGWEATNVSTRRRVHIKSAQRLRRELKQQGDGDPPPAPPSAAQEGHAQSTGIAALAFHDPERCATADCPGSPAMTYLGRPLCPACWDRQCGEERSVHEIAGGACRPASEPGTTEQEIAMTTKSKSTKTKGPRKATKTQPATKARKEKAAGSVATEKSPARFSALDAAAQVLRESGQAMRAGELIAAMAEKGLWSSPNGKTPQSTLYAAMSREINVKGKDSRFRKVDAGKFESAA